MSDFIESLDYRDISTPWEPQPIVSRYSLYRTNRDSIEAAVAKKAHTHLVREVRVQTHTSQFGYNHLYNDLSIEETIEGLALVDEQFRQLETLTDLRVAPTEWHVFHDDNGKTRTLARVQIIDGYQLPRYLTSRHNLSPEVLLQRQTLEEGIQAYRTNQQGPELSDIRSFNQYIVGRPRVALSDHLAEKAIYLVDIEPLLIPGTERTPLRSLPDHARGERMSERKT